MKPEDIIKFAKIAGKLKRTPRTGWKMRGVKKYESVAEHSFRTAVLAMLLSDLKGKNDRLIRMALLHDIEEAVTGDIITMEKMKDIKKAEKNARDGVEKVLSVLPKDLKEKYLKLWNESEQLKTKDAKLLKQIDYLEQMMQALEYEHELGVNLEEFWVFMEKGFKFTDPLIKNIFEQLKAQRPKAFK